MSAKFPRWLEQYLYRSQLAVYILHCTCTMILLVVEGEGWDDTDFATEADTMKDIVYEDYFDED